MIPVARSHQRLERCLEACARLTYEPRTICVVSDQPLTMPNDRHFINVVTGASNLTGPATKRDLASARCPNTDVYAYLDDDAYPPPHWLDEAARVLEASPAAAGAGGPGLMPDDQTYWERVSVATLEMRAGSGPLRFRFVREHARDCTDFPAYDLFIREDALEDAGGWATDWYGGEDTSLCARLAARGRLIRYDPNLFVHHYRRRLIPDHVWQIWNIGRSRGCLIREGDRYSRRMLFALPAFLIASAASLVLAPFIFGVAGLWVSALAAAAFILVALLGHTRPQPLLVRLAMPLALLVHHGAYACGIVYGLLTGTRTVRGVERDHSREPFVDSAIG